MYDVLINDFILWFQIRNLTSARIIFPSKTDFTNENITIFGISENFVRAKAESEVMKEHVDIN